MRSLKVVVTVMACAALVACSDTATKIVITLPHGFAAGRLTWAPQKAVKAITRTPAGAEFELTSGFNGSLRVEHPESCPLEAKAVAGRTVTFPLVGLVQVPEEFPQVGFGAFATIVVTAGCPDAKRGRIEWREVSELKFEKLEIKNDGFVVQAQLESLALARTQSPPHGDLISISFAQRHTHELIGTWRAEGHSAIELRTRISAATRASGLPNVSVGQIVYLEGASWAVLERPAGSAERLVAIDGAATMFQPNRMGRWVLKNGDEAPFSLHVGSFSVTPIDCGRSGCHEKAAIAVQDSPMTHAFEHRLQQAPGAMGCWLGCHVTGEKGLHDEGFFDVASMMPGADLTTLPLPRSLARQTGVQCLNCHGSGRIPEPTARWEVLQTGVCAQCHDAPPRYGHVKTWLASAMSRSDASPPSRSGECASCHTTAGFLGRPHPEGRDAQPLGITCSACHAPHSAHGPRLLRDLPLPEAVLANVTTDATTKICAQCHAPKSVTSLPASTAAAMVLGKGAVSLSDGSPLSETKSGHASLKGGCLACHLHSSERVERGETHQFKASTGDCTNCHEDKGVERRQWEESLIAAKLTAEPHEKGSVPISLAQKAGRVKWNTAFLLHDRAAWAHNPSYAAAILKELNAKERARP